jgi:predicted dehydrogenase
VLARGLPFFVEKPLGVGLDVAEQIARMVEESEVVTGTGYHWRCLDTVDTARRLAARTSPLLATGSWLGRRPPVAWWEDVEKSGGQVVEQMTHVLDLARVLLGEPVEVYAAGARHPAPTVDRGTVDDATAAVAHFADGAVATFAATSLLSAQHRAGLDLYASGAVLEVSETGLVVDDGESREHHEPLEDPRTVVDREFLEAVRGERPSTRAPYAEALRTHRFGCAIATAARERRPVALDPSSTELT